MQRLFQNKICQPSSYFVFAFVWGNNFQKYVLSGSHVWCCDAQMGQSSSKSMFVRLKSGYFCQVYFSPSLHWAANTDWWWGQGLLFGSSAFLPNAWLLPPHPEGHLTLHLQHRHRTWSKETLLCQLVTLEPASHRRLFSPRKPASGQGGWSTINLRPSSGRGWSSPSSWTLRWRISLKLSSWSWTMYLASSLCE